MNQRKPVKKKRVPAKQQPALETITADMIITRIERQKKNPGRYNIHINGEFSFGVHKNVLVDHALCKGDTLTREKIDAILQDDNLNRAMRIAERYLSFRPRSEIEIRTRLEKDEFDQSVINNIIIKLKNIKLIDDDNFARLFTESQIKRRPVGYHRINRELQNKGINKEIIENITKEYFSEDDELERAFEASRKKILKEKSRDQIRIKKRLSDHLARRGFGWNVIRKVIDETFK